MNEVLMNKMVMGYVQLSNTIDLNLSRIRENKANAMVVGVLAAVASIAAAILLYDKSVTWTDKAGTDTMTWGTGKLETVLK